MDICAKMVIHFECRLFLTIFQGEAGLFGGMVGGSYPFEYVTAAAAANIPRDWDYFHELILYDEISRIGFSPVIAALTNGLAFIS